MSDISTFKTELKNIINTIEFDSTTLGAAELVYDYERSAEMDHITEVHIFKDSLKSEILDNVNNMLSHVIVISVIAKVDGRQKQAQNDVDDLEEYIVKKLSQNFSNANWLFLDNYNIETVNRKFESNVFVRDIPIQIKKQFLTRTS